MLEEHKQIDALIWVAMTTGGTDIDADFLARSLAEFRRIVVEKISKIDGVQSTKASLMVDLVKDKYDWGTGWDLSSITHIINLGLYEIDKAAKRRKKRKSKNLNSMISVGYRMLV